LLGKEEEDDDEEGGSEKRQKTLDFSRFLDLEAEAGDDEEDEIEIEEGFEEVAAEAGADAGSGTSGAHHRLMNSIKDFEEAGVNEVALEKRFEYYNAGEDQGVASLVDVPTQGLQPSLLDPKLWMVKTKPGKEREAVIHIMNRFFLKRELGESLNVYSVLAPDHTKGFIFVEADKEPHVRAAIHGIPNVFSFKTTLVPLEQMTSVLRVSNEGVDVTPGMWVRVKRGLYVGDLGMVKSVDPSGTKLEVKLLPRLSLEAEETAEKGKRKKKVDISKRPPPRPFDPEEVTAKLGPGRVQTDQGDESVLYFLNDTYNRVLFFFFNVEVFESYFAATRMDTCTRR
jgi:transcription elongation factor SPT5